ncbi:e3 binding domain-containing protein [Thermus arciformis]|uniref:E3 binding domain-containing protein n=1 Tax=Thermus arciformis TaxID=482827 RepID=A0A1G7DFL6_9DEIN|nr:E3 binding domain-containing protein [Thermus arciformis]SDE49810.1 e3 binding domain-containing protein [Thermus arciformis]
MTEPNITPLARRLAEENGIDWRKLQGTGPDGTIVERDILAYLAKVMAGEVDLPPLPEAPPPLPPEEELKRAQEALEKEGVDLADLLPKAPTLQVEEVPEEELPLDFPEVDLDLEDDLLLAEEPEEAPPPQEAWEEDLLLTSTPPPQEAWEEAPPEEDFSEDLLQAEPPAPAPPPSALGVAPVPAPAPAPLTPLRVHRRRVGLKALEEAMDLFQRVHGVPKTPLPFLLRAAERALAELEIPMRALVGRVEGEEVRGLKPSPSFLALFREGGGEEGEGLLCFHGEEEVHTGRPSLFLSQEGLLAASGLEAPLARKLLERVALYLENPLLLLA